MLWNSQLLAQYPEIKQGSSLEKPAEAVYFGWQIHSNLVLEVKAGDQGKSLGEGDALFTKASGLILAVRGADCLPVLVYNPVQKIIGAAHAGWQGTALQVLPALLKKMGKPSDLRLAFGPGICGQCYDVSTVTDNRREQIAAVVTDSSKVILEKTLDLPEANLQQAVKAGVLPENIERSPICTFENLNFPSYRRTGQPLHFWSYISII